MNESEVDQDRPQETCFQSCRLVCNDAIITTDSRGILNSCSHGAQTLLGYLPNEIMGMSFAHLLKGGEGEVQRIQRHLQVVSDVDTFESELVGKDRTVIPVSLSASLLRDGEGIAQGIIAICHDLRPMRRLEGEVHRKDQLLTSIIRDSADAIITLDSGEHVTFWNKGAEAVFGYSEAEMLGRTLEILLPEDLKAQGELTRISETAWL